MENSTQNKKYVMALDAGTTSSRAILFDANGRAVASAQREFRQIFPHPAWVEHDALEIYETQLAVMREVLEAAAVAAGAGKSSAEVRSSCAAAGAKAHVGISDFAANVAAIGITNQRETTVVWNKHTGMPVYNAIVWQCRRTAPMIEKLCRDRLSDYVHQTTGLVPDAYFSGSKIAWILDNVEGARAAAEAGDLLFGTIDTWLVWNLTGGAALREQGGVAADTVCSLAAAQGGAAPAHGGAAATGDVSACEPVHVTDVTNASRTMLFDIHKLQWDKILLDYFNIPESMLPRVVMSSEVIGYTSEDVFGTRIQAEPADSGGTCIQDKPLASGGTCIQAKPLASGGACIQDKPLASGGTRIPIAGIAGDQQAALFGQLCVAPGDIKNTYGTGCFTLMNTGEKPISSSHGLLTTIAYGIDGKVNYALEGSVFIAGAAVQWLRDELNLIDSAAASEDACRAVADTDGVYVVPAFAGIGAPYWNPNARGTIVGVTRGTNKNHFIRAVVESLAYQVADLICAMEEDLLSAWGEELAGAKIDSIRVDGGASANDFLMEFQANILNKSICRSEVLETTALGVAYLAGLATDFWKSIDEIEKMRGSNRKFYPTISGEERTKLLAGWKRAVRCALAWASE